MKLSQDVIEPRSASETKTTFFVSLSECHIGHVAERHLKQSKREIGGIIADVIAGAFRG